jgi:hypothetical protein
LTTILLGDVLADSSALVHEVAVVFEDWDLSEGLHSHEFGAFVLADGEVDGDELVSYAQLIAGHGYTLGAGGMGSAVDFENHDCGCCLVRVGWKEAKWSGLLLLCLWKKSESSSGR